MSHRRHKRTISDEQDEGLSLAEGIIWKLTAYTLARLKTGEDRARQPNLSSRDFHEALKYMDESGSIIKRLDPNALESIAPDDLGRFLEFYAVACVTGMARKLKAVDTLVGYQMISFQNPGESQVSPALADCPRLSSVLAPIQCEYPFFCNLFLGILQSGLERTLGKERLLPSMKVDRRSQREKGASGHLDGTQADIERRIALAKEFLTPKKLLAETRTAIIRYFEQEIKQGPRILIKALAEINVSHVFIWLINTRILDELIDDLVMGQPLLHRIFVDGQEDYIPTEEGRDTPISAITDENG